MEKHSKLFKFLLTWNEFRTRTKTSYIYTKDLIWLYCIFLCYKHTDKSSTNINELCLNTNIKFSSMLDLIRKWEKLEFIKYEEFRVNLSSSPLELTTNGINMINSNLPFAVPTIINFLEVVNEYASDARGVSITLPLFLGMFLDKDSITKKEAILELTLDESAVSKIVNKFIEWKMITKKNISTVADDNRRISIIGYDITELGRKKLQVLFGQQ